MFGHQKTLSITVSYHPVESSLFRLVECHFPAKSEQSQKTTGNQSSGSTPVEILCQIMAYPSIGPHSAGSVFLGSGHTALPHRVWQPVDTLPTAGAAVTTPLAATLIDNHSPYLHTSFFTRSLVSLLTLYHSKKRRSSTRTGPTTKRVKMPCARPFSVFLIHMFPRT